MNRQLYADGTGIVELLRQRESQDIPEYYDPRLQILTPEQMQEEMQNPSMPGYEKEEKSSLIRELASAPDPMADLYNQFLNMKKQGIIPQDMDFESFKDLIREQVAYGGQMRQQYGLGSIVKKAVKGVTNVVKDVVKSDVGKAALGIAGLYYAPALLSGGALSPGLAGYQSGLGFAGNVLKSKLADIGLTSLVPKTALGRAGAISAIGGLTGFLSSQGKSEEEIEAIKRDPNALKTYLRQYYTCLLYTSDAADE